MYVDQHLSACAGCPAGTVALGAGGADTYTQLAIPDLSPASNHAPAVMSRNAPGTIRA